MNGEISAYTEDENEGVEIIAGEIEDELEEAITGMIEENEENTDVGEYIKQGLFHRAIRKETGLLNLTRLFCRN